MTKPTTAYLVTAFDGECAVVSFARTRAGALGYAKRAANNAGYMGAKLGLAIVSDIPPLEDWSEGRPGMVIGVDTVVRRLMGRQG